MFIHSACIITGMCYMPCIWTDLFLEVSLHSQFPSHTWKLTVHLHRCPKKTLECLSPINSCTVCLLHPLSLFLYLFLSLTLIFVWTSPRYGRNEGNDTTMDQGKFPKGENIRKLKSWQKFGNKGGTRDEEKGQTEGSAGWARSGRGWEGEVERKQTLFDEAM